MDFDSRFFPASAILSLLTGMSYRSYTWLLYLEIVEFPNPWLWLVIEPAKIVFGVFLSFAVMYILTNREKPEIGKSLFFIVLLGCWLGRLVVFAIDVYVAYPKGISDLLHFILTTAWEIFASLFSITLFVSLTAILLACYQKQQRERLYRRQGEAQT